MGRVRDERVTRGEREWYKKEYESGRRRKMHESKNLLIFSVSLEIKDLIKTGVKGVGNGI